MRLSSKKWIKRSLAVILLLFSIYVVCILYISLKPELSVREKLTVHLELSRLVFEDYYSKYNDYPILKSEYVNFWNASNSEFLWETPIHNYMKLNPPDKEAWRNHSYVVSNLNGEFHRPDEELPFYFLNPITNRFDWLAEDASGTLYSPDMPDSILIASPPIRVVNIRCPLTASDPPFYEDFTKW